jgi:threonine/homoserine/homoserine lactone efflux protein
MLTWVFVKGLIVGFLIAAPVGPINVLCIRRTIVHGRVVGLVSGLGAAVADTFFGIIAAFGVAFVQKILLAERFWLSLAGAVVLAIIGLRILNAEPPRPAQTPDPPDLLHDFTSTFFLTLTNPITILSFLAAFSAFGVGLEEGEPIDIGEFMLVAGVFVGASAWWLMLTEIVHLFHGRIPDGLLRWANHVAGTVILVFAAGILWSAYEML